MNIFINKSKLLTKFPPKFVAKWTKSHRAFGWAEGPHCSALMEPKDTAHTVSYTQFSFDIIKTNQISNALKMSLFWGHNYISLDEMCLILVKEQIPE